MKFQGKEYELEGRGDQSRRMNLGKEETYGN